VRPRVSTALPAAGVAIGLPRALSPLGLDGYLLRGHQGGRA
jgi:hypothetical protein